ncbi:hypothetical protein ACWKW6_33900 [Dyadobacter jiangsuensis]
MLKTQTLDAFYALKFADAPPERGLGDFNVFRLNLSKEISHTIPYARYDFYKIMLIRGRHRCHFATKSIEFDGSTLLFFSPAMPYSFERLATGSASNH